MKMLKVLSLFLVVFFLSCSEKSENEKDFGKLSLKLSQNTKIKTLVPEINMEISSYDVSGIGPLGSTFQLNSTTENIEVDDLIVGDWNVVVNALNSNSQVIGTASANISIVAAVTNSLQLSVVPVEGTGQLNLEVNWNTGSVQNPTIESELIATDGSPIALNFNLVNQQATYSNISIATGYYTLVIKLMDNNQLAMGAVEIIRIVNNAETAGSYNFEGGNGKLDINVTPDMAEPIEITLTGQQISINEGETMSLVASVSEEAGNVTYIWYINGESVAVGNTFNVNNLSVGLYRLDVTAINANGTRAGSVTHRFVVNESEVIIPDPVYNLVCDEGTGTTITDSVTGATLNAVTTDINWCQGNIKGYSNKWYIQSGANNNSRGVVQGSLIENSLDEYSITFLTRINDNGNGCILNPLGSGLHFRFWGGVWDNASNLQANSDDVTIGKWVRVTYVQTLTEISVYIDNKLSSQYAEHRVLPAGDVRIGAYNSNNYFYPGEYTDIKIYDSALTQEQINLLSFNDGVASTNFALLNDGEDLGGLWKREEHGGVYNSILTIENNVYKHWFNGDTCWGAFSRIIPASTYQSLWFSGDFMYPANLTANHDLGPTVQTIGLYSDLNRSNPIAIIYLIHDDTTQDLTLYRVSYNSTYSGRVNVALDGRTITKDTYHRFEINYNQGESGSIIFYMNGEELHTVSGDFDLSVQQVMYGLNLGIHPETPGDSIYSDNLYVGVDRLQ